MRSIRGGATSATLVFALVSTSGAGQEPPVEWIVDDGGVLELKLVEDGPCGGILRVDPNRRVVRWEGVAGDIGCRDGFEAGFDDVKSVRTRSEAGFVMDFRKGAGKKLALLPLPHAFWFNRQYREQNGQLERQLDQAGVHDRDGDAIRLGGGATAMVRRVELPAPVVADTRKAVDRILQALGRPAAPATVLREALYGRPDEAELSDVLDAPATFVGRAVRVRGRLEPVEVARGTYRLVDGDAAVAAVPDGELAAFVQTQVEGLKGKDVELTGLFRRGDESTGAPAGYAVAFWEMANPSEGDSAAGEGRRVALRDLVASPESAAGEVVRVVGKFRGKNLFGDLPANTQRRTGDWIIKEERYAVWITGKPPEGTGFKLDPESPGDARTWVEVLGRAVARGGHLYIEAREVALAPPPPGGRVLPARQILVGREQAPAVVFVLPLEGEPVAEDARFVIQFSKHMDEESFKGRVRLHYVGPPEISAHEFAPRSNYDEERRSLVVDPGEPLRAGREIEIELLPGIIDVDGMPLAPRPGRQPGGAVDVLRYVVVAQG